MKNLILIALIFAGVFSIAQERIPVPKHLQDISIQYDQYLKGESSPTNLIIPEKSGSNILSEEEIGDTRYDNQSNASIPKKIYVYDDGTIGATWTRSMEEGSFFADRGTGYNYYNGGWGDWPADRVEDIKVHRPVYAPWGENGEMIVSHTSGSGLYIATCEEKGSGDWDFNEFSGPDGNDYIIWCRAVTSGENRDRIHLLALTLPESHGGEPYEGLNGALLYSLSTNGGVSWDIENEILDGMSSDEYNGFAGDTYAFAEPVGDVVAFVVGDPWTGLFQMKSMDGGVTFEKTVIWNHPYPDWEFGMEADTFYCADGSQSLAIDSEGKVHVAFGITRAEADAQNTYLYPWVDGIAYWNEDMPAYSNGLHTLNPNDHPESELVEDETLIGWSQDVNGNGELEFEDDMGHYFIGLSSMPQLMIDNLDHFYLIYSSTTETFSNGLKNYRHIWGRRGNPPYWGDFIHVSDDLIHIFDECVFPAMAPKYYDGAHLIYQADSEPGTAVWASQHEYVDNRIIYSHLEWLPVGFDEDIKEQTIFVGQNQPNPFRHNTIIQVETLNSGNIELKVLSITGQTIYEEVRSGISPGKHLFELDGSGFKKGIYFYTLSNGTSSITKKMIVD